MSFSCRLQCPVRNLSRAPISRAFIRTCAVPSGAPPTDADLAHVALGICQGTPPGGTCPYSCADSYRPVFGASKQITCEGGAWVVGTAACGIPCPSPTTEDLQVLSSPFQLFFRFNDFDW